jgi:hypothetical protein
MLSDNFNAHLNSIFTFIFENYKQLLLFILVFIIIFIVEYITNINALMYGVTQIPGVSGATPQAEHKKNHVNRKKRKIKK